MDEKQVWRTIRKELEDIGITVAAFDANKEFILDWFKEAIAKGVFEEQTLEDTEYPIAGQSITEVFVPPQKATQKASTQRVRIPRVSALVAWVFRYDKALINTAIAGDEAAVKLLLEKGADVNAKEKYGGYSALHRAAEKGHEAVVRLLLEEGADVNAKGKYELYTALHEAAEKGHEAAEKGNEAVVQLLLEKGADVNAKTVFGQTALYMAAWWGDEAVVRLLLEAKADVNTKDKSGGTALHRAAEKGHEAVVRLLLEKGTDANTEDDYGKTALHLAVEKWHMVVVRLLQSHSHTIPHTTFSPRE